MSDQNTPHRPTVPPRPSITTAAADGYRSDVRIDNTTTPPRSGGFSTGVLVAIVFAVIAVMAAVLFNNSDRMGSNGGGTSDEVNIENNMAPAANAPAASDTGATAPALVAPATDAPAADVPATDAPAADAPAATTPDATTETAPSGTDDTVTPAPAPAQPVVPTNP